MTLSRFLIAALFLGLTVTAPLRAQTPAHKGAAESLRDLQATPPPPAPGAPSRPPEGVTPGTAAPGTPVLKPGEVLLNFQAADIQAVVKAMGQMTRRNFLLDPRVKGQVTIISAKPVSTAAAYQIFLSALKAQGFTAVEGIGHTRIIPTTDAKANADVTDSPSGGERMVTHVLIVQHNSASQMIALLRPLMSPTSQLSAFEPANALIITDYADNIQRMLRIVEKIDQPVSTDVTIIPLKHASALDLADLVTRLSLPGVGQVVQPGIPPGAGAGADRFTIVPDMRTNSLLVRADNPGRVNQIQSLVEKLDVPAVRGGNTRVVYLRNADATKLVEVLRGLLAGEARAQQATTAAVPGAVGARPTTGARTADASLIQADEATNALVINAPDAVYNNLRGVIEKLDVRRTQVYVEALIVEMSEDRTNELGVQWAGGAQAGQGAVAGVQNFPGANPSLIGAVANPTAAFTGAGGLMLGYLGPRVTLPDGTVIRGIGALARALEANNMANILSTPNLLTLDNAEAKIVVGQNVPFVTGSFATTPTGTVGGGTNANPFQTIERKDVGLTLKIKPQVSEGGLIKLDIYQEVSSVVPSIGTGASDLITNKRSIETKVVVDDGQTIVLGGLIDDTRTENEQAVPFLGKIPFFGALFRYRAKSGKRTNLMVFLRPAILYGPNDSYGMTADRYDYLHLQSRGKIQSEQLDRFKPTTPGNRPGSKDKDPRRNDDDEVTGRTAPAATSPASPPATDTTAPAAPAPTPAPTPTPATN